ncbi:MAG: TetR/AcrR family transcriptional regulator [Solirubrobacteraceae bacterium]|jgi:AcrR family transcriptional regulator|nr:TetR/AcrR family transcriptional regulator [Solirubrobacteraceae bacterium]
MPSSPRLDRDAWVGAGLAALERDGVDGVAVVPLARALGVTRGSFYWHFASRDELLAAVLERWELEHSEAVLQELAAVADPRARLTALLDRAVRKPPTYFARLLDAEDREPLVAAVLARSAARRTEAIAAACRELGLAPAEARRRALLAYAAYVGLARGAAAGLAPRERAAFARHVVATLVP